MPFSSVSTSPRNHPRPFSPTQYVYSQLWVIPVIFLLTTIVYLQYKAPAAERGVGSVPGQSSQIDLSLISDMIKKEVQGYLALYVTPPVLTDPTQDTQDTPTGASLSLGVSQSKVYPPVTVLPDSQVLRIVVTGGSGFVGSHLVDRLLGQGHQVTVLDNFFTGRARNLAQWTGHPHFQLITHDITEPIKLECDQIYHLACPASPPHYQYNPIKTIKTNTQGTLNMLGMAKRVGARMLLASTSEVYGDPEVHPQPESYWGNVNPIGPRACYDEGKRVAETMMYAYYGQSNIEVRVARIFNTFGPRMHPNDGRVVSNFVIQALQGNDLTIYGQGTQTRSFQYVDDLVSGLIRLMNGNYSYPVNLGNPQEFTVADFASLIVELTGSNSSIRHLPATEDDPKQRKPDITLAGREIGWAPVIPVRDGLVRTIAYFRGELARNGGKIVSTGPFATKPQPVVKGAAT